MSEVVWQIEHTVEADVSATFAWNYWSNVANWDDPPAEFVLDGAFVEGSVGTTRIPGQDPIQWRIRDVLSGKCATIEIELDRATASFTFSFKPVSATRTELTQHIVLKGENAAVYVEHMQAGFGTLPEGMKRLAAAMTTSAIKSIGAS